MIYKYKINNLYDILFEDNKEVIGIIPEIVSYNQGIWNDNKRYDRVKIDIVDIPYNLRIIIDLIRDCNGLINLIIKNKKSYDNNKIIIKSKIKLNGFLGEILNNNIKIKSKIVFEDNIINFDYDIITPIDLDENFKSHIKNKIDNYYIKRIDDYLKEWKN